MSNPDQPKFRAYVPEVPGVDDLERIGRGGFARVYRGWQSEMHRLVAVKVLDGVIDDPESDRRFRREVAAMGAASHHPNVVPVYVTGVTADGHPFLVMPFLPGGTLGDRLRNERLKSTEVAVIGAKVAGALAAAHATGVLHRDVKPSNILFSAYGEPQLADFGIARLADATRTTSGSVAATIAYAAPELLSGAPARPASDVYSLGASLHAALTGRPPFVAPVGEPLAVLVARVAAQRPADLRPLGVTGALAGVIESAMATDPATRTATAEAFRRQLEDAGSHTELSAGPTRAVNPARTVATESVPVGETGGLPPEPHASAAPIADSSPPAATEPVENVTARSRGARRPAVLIGVLVVALLAAVGALVVRALGDDGSSPTSARTPPSSEPPTSTSTTVGPSGVAGQPATRSSGNGAGTSTSSPPLRTSTIGAPTPEAAVNEYYRLVDGGSLQTGFKWLTSRYQADAGGFTTYQRFWRSIRSVRVLGVERRGDTIADATLRYEMQNGSVSVERVELRFARDATTGNLLIDGYRVR